MLEALARPVLMFPRMVCEALRICQHLLSSYLRAASQPCKKVFVPKKTKNPAAVALGRLGGKKTAKQLKTTAERKRKGKELAAARWSENGKAKR